MRILRKQNENQVSMRGARNKIRLGWIVGFVAIVCLLSPLPLLVAQEIHDLSLLVSPRYPCVWPVGMQQHLVIPSRTFGPGAFHRDMVVIDEHTGTQWDAPAHFVPPPDSGLPGAGPNGLITGEKVPAWQFIGEACVIDVREKVDAADKGASFLISPEIVQEWERKHRPLGAGDVVLFRSDYSDKYYKPLAEGGERFVHTVLRSETPGWPAPTPQCMEYLASRGVMTLGLDGASMGPVPDLAVATHQAGGKHGMVWMECGTNLGSLPVTGGAYVLLPAKHKGGSGNEARAIGFSNPKTAKRLIDSAKAKKIADLSVVMDDDLPVTWTGGGPGEEATRYLGKTLNAFSKTRGPYFARTHTLDSQAGTHVVTPSYALPPKGFDRKNFSADVRRELDAFEKKNGTLPAGGITVDRLPLDQMVGDAHPIDVSSLMGTVEKDKWPASPTISLEFIKQHEQKRPIKAGEVVIFVSGYSDAHFKPLPEAPEVDRLFAAPLSGKAEGWPAPAPEVLAYLADKGVRCVGTDGPTMGGVESSRSMQVYWTAASKGIVLIEFLTGVKSLPENFYFIFAPIRIAGLRAGYGRALAAY
ncbi:MAG: Kynurenine formamidase [Planctomycetota bacterium]